MRARRLALLAVSLLLAAEAARGQPAPPKTRAPIPLEELRYWSVERQEAYASPEAVLTSLGLKKKAQR